MHPNPYEDLHARYVILEERRKWLDADFIRWKEEALTIFLPDQAKFDDLKDQVKQKLIRHSPQVDLDKLYYDMVMIYKRWLPCMDMVKANNPDYIPLFQGLQMMLRDLEAKAKIEESSGN